MAQALNVERSADPSEGQEAGFDGAINVKRFGAIGDGVTNDAAAFVAALAYLKSIAVNDDVYYKGSARLYVPTGHYFLGTTTLDIGHTLILEGDSGVGGGVSTLLRWAANTTGIRIQSYNTNGGAGTDGAPFHHAGAGTLIRNIALRGGYAGTEGEFHGIHARAGFTLENFWIDNFQGDGIYANTTATGGGGLEGNSNNTAIKRGRITNVRNGMFVDGADANVWLIESVDVTFARQWGYWDSSFLGNTGLNIHTANCGLVPGVAATVVSHGGNRYYVKYGQANWCLSNAPSGTTADNQGWGYLSAGAADSGLNIPAWANGVSVREGGGFKTDSPNARNQLIGCYTEGGQAPSQLISPTLVIGGLWGSDIVNNDATKEGATIIAADGSLVVPNKAFFGNLFAGPLGLKVEGIKVVGPQGAALPANATDLASAITLLNAIRARMVAHGLVAA